MNSNERKKLKLEKAKKRALLKVEKKAASRQKWRKRLTRILGFFSKLFAGAVKLLDRLGVRAKIQASIVAQLMINFLIALIVGVLVTVLSINMSVKERENVTTSYDAGYQEIFFRSNQLFDEISRAENPEEFFNIIDDANFFEGLMTGPEIYITDAIGNVLIKNDKATAEKLDILDVVEKAGSNYQSYQNTPTEIFRVFKIREDNDQEKLMIYIASPREDFIYTTEVIGTGGVFPYINGLITFVLTFILLTRKKMMMMTDISDALLFIADGNLDYEVDEDGTDEVALLAENINTMRRALKREKEEQARIEKTKSELITNVSHDLRTPLTSIMGYLGLIRNGQYQSEAEMLDYANTAFQKSEKLKVLIEDLFEYTKYANADIRLNMISVSVNELIEQIVSEYTPVMEENDLTCEISLPEETLFAELDPKRIVRACENLLMNAVKYADRPSVIEVALRQSDDGEVQVTFSNACPHIEEKDLENLFDRLYKVDKSRSETGSGLGLAITKGIIDAHGGRVFASQSQGRVHIGFVL